jgi:mRNA-degrading endonuclease RelE of RelBE toxin-antitoxin system
MRIELLATVKWEFIGLDRETKRKVARRIRRLPMDPEGSDVHRIVGTDYIFRLKVGEYRVLFHRKADLITLLAIAGQYSGSQIDEFVAKRRVEHPKG